MAQSWVWDSQVAIKKTAGLLTVASDKIAWTFNRSGVNQAVGDDISKAINRV